MIKRCVEISNGPAYLSVQNRQLLIRREGADTVQIPIEDIGVFIVDNPAVTYTHAVLSSLLENNVAVVLCGGHHHPAGLLMPLEGNSTQRETVAIQATASDRIKMKIWKDLIVAKITNQALTIKTVGREAGGLLALAKSVKPGDPDNIEAQAARRYWSLIFGKEFNRDRNGDPPNNLLNYGYTVVRASVARALCGAGLHPSLSVHHKNKYNAFALADDVMEPLRPLVDRRVHNLWSQGIDTLDKSAKVELLGVLSESVRIKGMRSPVMIALHRTAASLCKVLTGEAEKLEIPEPLNDADLPEGDTEEL